MVESRQQKWNRALTVGAGTFIWVLVLGVLIGEGGSVIWALLLSVWIALGSAHLVENISDFGEKMSGRRLLLAALVSPAWPWLRRMPRSDQN